MEIILNMTTCVIPAVHVLVSGKELISKPVIKLARSNYLLFTFCPNLDFIFLPAANKWTNNTITDCHRPPSQYCPYF